MRGVILRLSPAGGGVEPSRVALKRDGERWVARGAAIATPGRWRAVVTVDRGADSVEIPLAFHTVCPEPTTTQEVGDLNLYTIDVGGFSVQAYTDPATAGNNEVHFTVFDAKGEELPLADDATVTGVRGDKVVRLDPRKLSPGHYVAGGKLTAGEWVFDFDGETKGGDAVIVCFEDDDPMRRSLRVACASRWSLAGRVVRQRRRDDGEGTSELDGEDHDRQAEGRCRDHGQDVHRQARARRRQDRQRRQPGPHARRGPRPRVGGREDPHADVRAHAEAEDAERRLSICCRRSSSRRTTARSTRACCRP